MTVKLVGGAKARHSPDPSRKNTLPVTSEPEAMPSRMSGVEMMERKEPADLLARRTHEVPSAAHPKAVGSDAGW